VSNPTEFRPNQGLFTGLFSFSGMSMWPESIKVSREWSVISEAHALLSAI